MKFCQFVVLLAFVSLAMLPACKKCYTCTYTSGNNASYCKDNYNTAELNSLDTACVQAGGVWTHSNI